MMSLLKLIRGCLAITYLCVLLLLVNTAQMSSLVLLVFSRTLFMRFNMEMSQLWCGQVGWMAILCGNKLVVTGEKPRRESALAFANHQSLIDAIMIWYWASHDRITGWIRWFAKYELKFVPGLGWGMQFVNTLFVKRNWSEDALTIKATFAKLRNSGLPAWLMIFPEGTRATPEKIAASQEFAKRKGLPVLDRVLLPRGKGISASLQGMEGVFRAVYDITIYYDGPIPGLFKFYTEGGCVVHLHCKRYDISEVPTRERDLNAWLLNIFQEKNAKIASALSAGHDQTSSTSPLVV